MQIANKYYELTLDDKSGNISSFVAGGKQFIARQTPLVTLRVIDGKGNVTRIASDIASEVTLGKGSAKIVYDRFGEENISCTVTVRFAEDDANTYWGISLKNRSGKIVDSVTFPGVTVFDDLIDDGGTRRLFSSMMEGVEMRSTKLRSLTGPATHNPYPPRGWEGAYPGPAPMQFMAYYDGQDGLYFASHDAHANYKFVEWYAEDGGIVLLQEVYPQAAKKDFELDYPVVLGAYKGDWYDAAAIYRDWVMSSGLLKLPKFKDNPDMPEWIYDSPVVMAYAIRGKTDCRDMEDNGYYPYTNALQYVDKYSKAFDSRVMALLMHWEGTAPWAPPFVWPPYGDKNNFDEFSEKLHADGNLLGLYCSGLGWTQQSAGVLSYNMEQYFEENGIANYVEVGPTHELQYSTICGWPIRRGYDLCPACEPVKEIAENEIEKVVKGSDVDYFQFFDQNLGGNTYACYSENHGHPSVPGRWMAEEMLKVVHRMKKRAQEVRPDKKILIGCESAAAEPFVNDLFFNDLRYNINYLFGVPVPAYNYVFHGYVCNFMGNHNTSSSLIDLKNNDTNIYYRYAYSFAQGDIITFVLKNDGKINWEWTAAWDDEVEPDQDAIIAYIADLCAWRKGFLNEALNFGVMKKPLATESPLYSEELTVRAYGDRWKYGDYYRNIDGAVTTRFDTDGGDIQVFVNYQNKPLRVSVTADKFTLVTSPDGKERKTMKAGKDGKIGFEMPPRSVFAAIV